MSTQREANRLRLLYRGGQRFDFDAIEIYNPTGVIDVDSEIFDMTDHLLSGVHLIEQDQIVDDPAEGL